jgi:hypothetical protein
MRDRASGSTDGKGLLEPYEGQLSSTVLRGGDGGDAVPLPDHKCALYVIMAVLRRLIGSGIRPTSRLEVALAGPIGSGFLAHTADRKALPPVGFWGLSLWRSVSERPTQASRLSASSPRPCYTCAFEESSPWSFAFCLACP